LILQKLKGNILNKEIECADADFVVNFRRLRLGDGRHLSSTWRNLSVSVLRFG